MWEMVTVCCGEDFFRGARDQVLRLAGPTFDASIEMRAFLVNASLTITSFSLIGVR